MRNRNIDDWDIPPTYEWDDTDDEPMSEELYPIPPAYASLSETQSPHEPQSTNSPPSPRDDATPNSVPEQTRATDMQPTPQQAPEVSAEEITWVWHRRAIRIHNNIRIVITRTATAPSEPANGGK